MNPSDWDEKYRAASDRLWSAEPNLFVADRLAHHRPGRGVDLGSGEGRNAIWLARRGWQMVGVDFSTVAVERARRASSEVSWQVADVREWEPEQQVDLVLIAYLQMVPEELELVVRRSATWLDPDGELFMIGHDRTNLEKGYGGPSEESVLWDLPTIKEWLGGLEIVEAQRVRRPVETPEGVKLARDALVRARRA
ncbi:MAG TPA: class I SAM-dependent methyltransferase [Acidimicrobiia bacterium]